MSVYTGDAWKMQVLVQKFMGVWPYNNNLYDKCIRTFVYICLYSLIFPIGVRCFEEVGVRMDIVIENIVFEMYLNAGVIKFTMTILFRAQHKYIYDMIARDWRTTTDKEELKIMKKHAAVGRTISLTYGVCCCTTAGAVLTIPFLNPVLDVIVPLDNDSRPLMFPFYADYGIDEEKYYFLLMIKASISGTFSMIIFITYDMAFAMCVQHVCSLFEIINFRLQKASKLNKMIITQQVKSVNDYESYETAVMGHIKSAIQLHQNVIENISNLENTYYLNWFFILLLNTVAIGGSLYVVLLKLGLWQDLVRFSMFFACIFIHKYFIFLPGQKIINYSLEVFDNSYACDWYNFPPKSKVLIKIMMLRSIKPLHLTGGKMILLCMETYSSMLKAATSYFTVFASTQTI